jgi:biotin transport system substrate-specific component
MGLPVYADGQSGWQTFSGPSLGYFVGFLLAAALISLRRKRYSISFIGPFKALFAGHLVVLILGSLFLIRYYPLSEAFAAGFRPFMTGALIKSVLGAIVYFLYENTVKRAQ